VPDKVVIQSPTLTTKIMTKHPLEITGRRRFMKATATFATGILSFGVIPGVHADSSITADNSLLVIGPQEGYSPQIGTLVSMLNYNRDTIKRVVANLTVQQLDYLHDAQSNTIGALLMHLAAVDKFYQINTFEGRQEFNAEEKKRWDAGLELGDQGRKEIKGHDLKFYLDALDEVRQKTLAELKKKDDQWLLAIDPLWSKEQSINTYWKWFHVCEHESNHRGQISWLKGRLPGAKPGKE
jgi:uncharacterized damage-inducible protein DinB